MSMINNNSNINLPSPIKEPQPAKPATQSPTTDPSAKELSNENSKTESLKNETTINTQDKTQLDKIGSALNKIDLDPMPDKIKSKFDDIFSKIEKKNDPTAIIDKIRNSKPEDRTSLLLSFQTTIDKMTKEQVKDMRDYLVQAMADPNNSDDKLLGDLAKVVNKELDQRGTNSINHFPINNFNNNGDDNFHIVAKYSCAFTTRNKQTK